MIQQPFDFLLPESNWSCPTELPELHGAIAIDTETVDKYIKKYGPGYCISAADRGHIIGVSVADSNGFAAYYPVRHTGGGNLDPSIVFRWLKEQVKKQRPMIFANAQYDLGWLETEGVKIDPAWVHDVQIQAPLIDENRLSYSLDNLGKDFLGDKKKQDLLYDAARAYGIKDIKAQMDKLPAPFVGPYGEYDAVLTLRLWNHFNEIIDKQELQ
jgi:DNA polymerase I-like protein with 3'-5' exonuclease and polymerase domains